MKRGMWMKSVREKSCISSWTSFLTVKIIRGELWSCFCWFFHFIWVDLTPGDFHSSSLLHSTNIYSLSQLLHSFYHHLPMSVCLRSMTNERISTSGQLRSVFLLLLSNKHLDSQIGSHHGLKEELRIWPSTCIWRRGAGGGGSAVHTLSHHVYIPHASVAMSTRTVPPWNE